MQHLARIRPSDHEHATFPEERHIPENAREAVRTFQSLQERMDTAKDVQGQATRRIVTGAQEDREALDAHVLGGGSASSFTYTNTEAAKKQLADATAEVQAIGRLLGPTYMKAAYALKASIKQGMGEAVSQVTATTEVYEQAIKQVQEARRNYLYAVGLQLFWQFLEHRGECIAGAGYADSINLNRGPITRIDNEIFKVMSMDAKTHTRIDPEQNLLPSW